MSSNRADAAVQRIVHAPVSRLVAAAAVMLALVTGSPAHGYCKTPLADPALRALDLLADTDPAAAVTRAREQLSAMPVMDPAVAAQLYAVIADAQDTLENDREARAAVAAGLDQLERIAPSRATDALRVRLRLTEADSAEVEPDLSAAVAVLTALEPSVGRDTLGHACLMLSRSRLQSRLTHPDLAARDGIAAYLLTKKLGERDAAADAAYQLATTYRRAGLYPDALKMAEEAIAYARTEHQIPALADALFAKAQILSEMHEPKAALEASAESGALSARAADRIGTAFVDHERCNELLALARYEEAEQACLTAEAAFRAGNRPDQRAATLGNLARVDLARDRNSQALERLNAALAGNVPPTFLSMLHGARAEALARLGKAQPALADLKESARLADESGARQRSLAVAVMGARLQAEQSERANRELEAQVQIERQRAKSRQIELQLIMGLAGAALGLVVLLGYLLWIRSRHQRTLQQAAEVVQTHARVIHTVREGVLLVDAEGRIEYANPALLALFGRSGENLLGTSIESLGLSTRLLHDKNTEEPGGLPSGGHEVHWSNASGQVVSLLITGSTLQLQERTLHVLVLQDVTEMRRLEREVLEVASREREQLSGDVHEGLSQDLAGVTMLLKSITVPRQFDRESMNLTIEQLNASIGKARALARGLSPVKVARGELGEALEQLARDVTRAWPVTVRCHCALHEVELSVSQADHLYRIAHERVMTVARQPDSHRIAIELVASGRNLLLTITNDRPAPDGGFAEPQGETHDMVLRMIAYRARVLGGAARFEVAGTDDARLIVSVPIAVRSAPDEPVATQ